MLLRSTYLREFSLGVISGGYPQGGFSLNLCYYFTVASPAIYAPLGHVALDSLAIIVRVKRHIITAKHIQKLIFRARTLTL